jgi:uncharacterized protein (TIGR02246 family)
MAKRQVEDEVVGLEKQYWKAIKDKDFEAAIRLTDDPCIITGAQGVREIDHEAFRKIMKGSPRTLQDVKLDDVQVRLLSDDVAIVAYKVSLTVEGKPLAVEAADSSTWIRRDGRWLCALHTEALTGDPFGRDRRPSA